LAYWRLLIFDRHLQVHSIIKGLLGMGWEPIKSKIAIIQGSSQARKGGSRKALKGS